MPCIKFVDWTYSANSHLIGFAINPMGRTTETQPNWSDTYQTLDAAKVACIEGFRVKIKLFRYIKIFFNIWKKLYSRYPLIVRFCNLLSHFRKNTAKNGTKAGTAP